VANTLIFVDFPVPDPEVAQHFYEDVFGWTIKGRPPGDFHQVLPGEGLHIGIFNEQTQPPDPDPKQVAPRSPNQPRIYVLVENEPADYVDKAVSLGGTKLWGETYWKEFGGWHASFRDPWGNQIVVWHTGKPAPADESLR